MIFPWKCINVWIQQIYEWIVHGYNGNHGRQEVMPGYDSALIAKIMSNNAVMPLSSIVFIVELQNCLASLKTSIQISWELGALYESISKLEGRKSSNM